MNTEQPMSKKMTRPVNLCSLMPRKRGCSPGAELSDSSFRLLTWEMDRTVAATNQGKPMMEHTANITPTISRSRWYPQPFCTMERIDRYMHIWVTAGGNSAEVRAVTAAGWFRFSYSYQQFVFFAVDDDSSYLLVHENEDGAEKSWNRGRQDCPPWVASYWTDQPTSVVSGRLKGPIKEK